MSQSATAQPTPQRGLLATALDARRGTWPERYEEELRTPAYASAVAAALRPGMRVLDVGAGAAPSVDAADRPEGVEWVGQDIVASELAKAPEGAYDGVVVGSITEHDPALDDRFDLIVSRFVFEHVTPLPEAIEHLRRALVPGGRLIALLSGRWSAQALLNRVVPTKLAERTMGHTIDRDPETIFPAHYDHCDRAGLERTLAGWRRAEVRSYFCGGGYFKFSPTVLAAYIGVEELVARRGWDSLATYYVVDAER